MKYFDTSALLRAWKNGWTPPQGLTRPHTVAEWMHIQVGRGLIYEKEDGTLEKRTLPWALAASEARRMFGRMKFVDVTGPQTLEAMESVALIPGLSARAVHDFMHVRAAELADATAAVTTNLEEWSRLTKLPLELPQPSGEASA